MNRSKIFIASSGRTLVLAERLRDELATDFCEATLWSQEGGLQLGSTIIEMLEGAAKQYDFAAIILARDDVLTSGVGEVLKARDNCVFEAGLFISAVGRKRCFLVNSVEQSDLPSDLGGVISIRFKEPSSLQDRKACTDAILPAAAQLKNIIQDDGPLLRHATLPVLSVDEVFRRERPVAEGGDLSGGDVVVCDTQPWAEISLTVAVRRNIDNGTRYQYFLYFSDDTVEKICQSLQVISWAGLTNSTEVADYKSRLDTIRSHGDRVVSDMLDICRSGRLRISLVPDEQPFYFRVHNASNPTLARYYARYREEGFVLWTEGPGATTLWRSLPTYLEEDREDRLFIPLRVPAFDDDKKQRLKKGLTRGLSRYFPGVDEKIKTIFLGEDY
jgi:Predicted nucleotide-binding protein containing TIR-like domain